MKKKIRTAFEKFFLTQRNLVETVMEQLKSICHIEHSRHRNLLKFLINLVDGLAAYSLKPQKPIIKIVKLSTRLESLIHNIH